MNGLFICIQTGTAIVCFKGIRGINSKDGEVIRSPFLCVETKTVCRSLSMTNTAHDIVGAHLPSVWVCEGQHNNGDYSSAYAGDHGLGRGGMR